MELELVTFEQAKSLKELGFPQNIYTSKVYLEKNIPHDIIAKECGLSDWQCIGGGLIPCSSDYNKYGVDTCSCPTLALCAKWLRKEKNIFIDLTWGNMQGKIIWCASVNNLGKGSSMLGDIKPVASYEEALSAGIDKAIEILKEE